MDFSVDEKYYFDREDAQHAKGKSEWDALWYKYLKSQAIRYKLQDKKWDEISTSLEKRYNISKNNCK